jgi:hypothetical protein
MPLPSEHAAMPWLCMGANHGHARTGAYLIPQHVDFFRPSMKTMPRTQSQYAHSKRNGKLVRTKHRKGGKKKPAARPFPLWLQMYTRAD